MTQMGLSPSSSRLIFFKPLPQFGTILSSGRVTDGVFFFPACGCFICVNCICSVLQNWNGFGPLCCKEKGALEGLPESRLASSFHEGDAGIVTRPCKTAALSDT